MRRASLLLGTGCVLALVLACFHAVLFRGHQFAYRDAGHFYYPLYRVVQQEWAAGRLPLWNPWQNGGAPLLGTPMAAVLYPGKLLYAVLPYPQAARAYILAHTIIAMLGMLALGRALGLSGTGSMIAALSYAFGAPVLSLYSNVILLVGAAWAPWGFRAIHRLAGPDHRWAMVELAAVLSLQVLGGDPESAYWTAASGALYAGVIAFARGQTAGEATGRRAPIVPIALALVAAWFAMVLGADLVATRGWVPARLSGGPLLRSAVGLGLIVLVVRRSRRAGARVEGLRMMGRLAGAGLLAMLLTAAQLGPAWDYARRSTRLEGRAPALLYDYSVEPCRLAEAVWPHVFGLAVPRNDSWLEAMPPPGDRMLWSPSLYVGGFVLVLAVVGAGLRDGPPWRRWLTILALVGLIAGMGKFAGPLWWARRIPGVAGYLGAPDPPAGIRRPDADPAPPDGAGSLYGLLAMVLPGFAIFRYPAKLVVLASMSGSALAGLGWDRIGRAGPASRSARRWCLAGAAVSVGLAVPILAGRAAIERWVEGHVSAESPYGPVDPAGALDQTLRALIQGGAVYAAGAALAALAAGRPGRAGAGALILVTADLAMAGPRIVWTAPQAVFDATPRIVALIEQAERAGPSRGPFRVHRAEQRPPDAFSRRRSPDRLSELTAWQRDTIDHLDAEPFGLPYTEIRGYIDIGDYLEFFESRATRGRDDRGNERTVYSIPRGGYDLWNTRYFVMPVGLNGWIGPERGFTRIAPSDEVVADPDRARRWIDEQGWQLLRNDHAFPRCWVVASVVAVPPTAPGSPSRAAMVRKLVAPSGPGGFDPRRMAFVEADDPRPLSALIGPPPAEPIGSATIVRADPDRVEIGATLRGPGLVVLADVLDPGWRLAIDGTPAPIWRANRLMRGALVSAGDHTLVYTYRPVAFRVGAAISTAGLLILVGLVFRAARSGASRRPRTPAGPDREGSR